MSNEAMIWAGVIFGLIATMAVPFAIAAPRLRKEYRESRKKWLDEHPEHPQSPHYVEPSDEE